MILARASVSSMDDAMCGSLSRLPLKNCTGSVTVNTGFQSFDDAFGDKVAREEVIELVSRGKYRVRRNT